MSCITNISGEALPERVLFFKKRKIVNCANKGHARFSELGNFTLQKKRENY